MVLSPPSHRQTFVLLEYVKLPIMRRSSRTRTRTPLPALVPAAIEGNGSLHPL
jgi:hypothetical protein